LGLKDWYIPLVVSIISFSPKKFLVIRKEKIIVAQESIVGGEKGSFHHLSLKNNVSQLEKNVKKITVFHVFILHFYKNFTEQAAKHPVKFLISFSYANVLFQKNHFLLIITCILVVFTDIHRNGSQISSLPI